MKKKNFSLILLLIFLISSISIFAERVINQDKLIRDEKSDIIYVEGEDKPFTGTSKSYYENDKIQTEIPYINGKINGIYKKYYENGNLEGEAFFKDNMLNGIAKTYHESGVLRVEENYVDGKNEGVKKGYLENGTLYFEGTYTNGLLNGLIKFYYENGNIHSEKNYKNDKLNGKAIYYNKNGNIDTIANFIDDKLDGSIVVYKEDGTLDFIAPYKNGEPLSDKQIIILEYPNENSQDVDDIVDNTDYSTKNTFFSLYGSYIIIGIIVLVILTSILKIYKAFPQTKNLSDEDRNKILNILMKYRGEHKGLHSSYRLNGFGTGFYRVRSMMVDEEKIIIYAKMISLLFIPAPITLGYLVCYRKDKILGSYSNAEFEEAKREIKEKVLYI